MTGKMLSAYYSKGCDSHSQFNNLKVSASKSYSENLNSYNVLFLNIQDFLSEAENSEKMIDYLKKRVLNDLKRTFKNCTDENNLSSALRDVYEHTQSGFVIIIDEWDCIFREEKNKTNLQKKYLDFLRNLLKDKPYISLVYMTGILPIKKYGSHSALNMFRECSMIDMGFFSEFTGFTEEEVKFLCEKYNIDFSEMKKWYDGYLVNECHIYNPKSVVDSILMNKFTSYWTNTETYEALKIYLDMNFNGLKDAVISMLSYTGYQIDAFSFQNDMETFMCKDDVLTLLVHLGYLSYDEKNKNVFIPNKEVREEFIRSVKHSDNWTDVVKAINNSEKLLEETIHGNADFVAWAIENIHTESTSILSYNNENSLSCVISLAYYSARNYYKIIREMPSGKGFADIVFIPKKYTDKPAIIIELKFNKSANEAICQIKNKEYAKIFENYVKDIVLVGINYDKSTKKHSCIIEKSYI